MAKPDKYPRWATGGGAIVAEPSEGDKDNGWAYKQKPPSNWFNWLLLKIYQWLYFLYEEMLSPIITDAGALKTDVVGSDQIAAGAVDSSEIAANAVVEAKLATGAVTVNKIGTGAVTEGKIGAEAVTAGKIGAGAVTEAKIGAGAVTEAKIGAGAVTEDKIGAGAVTNAKIGATAVTEAKIGTGAVTEAKIGAGAVTNTKIGSGAVDTDELASKAVTAAKIDDNTIGQGQIASGGVGADELAGTSVTPEKLNIGGTEDYHYESAKTLKLTITPSDFVRGDATNGIIMLFTSGGKLVHRPVADDVNKYLFAPVHLPEGATIKEIKMAYSRNAGSGATVAARLWKTSKTTPPTAPSDTSVVTITSDTDGYNIKSSGAMSEQIQHNNFYYTARVRLTNNNVASAAKFYYFEITYEITNLRPVG